MEKRKDTEPRSVNECHYCTLGPRVIRLFSFIPSGLALLIEMVCDPVSWTTKASRGCIQRNQLVTSDVTCSYFATLSPELSSWLRNRLSGAGNLVDWMSQPMAELHRWRRADHGAGCGLRRFRYPSLAMAFLMVFNLHP